MAKPSRKLPMRICKACGISKEKAELIRLVAYDGKVFVDPSGKANGRGAYICKSLACLENALEKRSLNRALRQTVSPEAEAELRRLIET